MKTNMLRVALMVAVLLISHLHMANGVLRGGEQTKDARDVVQHSSKSVLLTPDDSDENDGDDEGDDDDDDDDEEVAVSTYGPKKCLSVWKDGQGDCVMQTKCKNVDTSDYNFGMICVDNKKKPVWHYFGKDSFKAEEKFDTLLTCDQCLGLDAMPAPAKVPEKIVEPEGASLSYGPKNCVSVKKGANGNCIMTTDCGEADMKEYNYGVVCKSGDTPVQHMFGKDSFEAQETFDTLLKCDECLGLSGVPSQKQAEQLGRRAHREALGAARLRTKLKMATERRRRLSAELDDVKNTKGFKKSLAGTVKDVANETQSKALAGFLGDTWKEMRMLATPFYEEHLEEEIATLSKREAELQAKIDHLQKQQEWDEKRAAGPAKEEEPVASDGSKASLLQTVYHYFSGTSENSVVVL